MNAECIRRYYKTCNSEDPGALRAFYRDDVVLTHGSLEPAGIQALMTTYRNMIAQFHAKMTPLYLEQADGTVNVELMDRFTA